MERTAEEFMSRQVDILYDFNPAPICTGTILSSYLIVTLASCLLNRSKLKITIQTQPLPQLRSSPRAAEDEEGEEEETRGRETRYVDSFYTIQAGAAGQNGTTSASATDLAVILLDEKLRRRENQVEKANLPESNEVYAKIYKPYTCFDSADPDERWRMTLDMETMSYPDCMKDGSRVTPPGCISDIRPGLNNFHCPASAPGSGLFCEFENESGYVLCGILLSYEAPGAETRNADSPSHPLYVKMQHYLHGFFLKEVQGEMEGESDAEESWRDLAATAYGGAKVDFDFESFPYQLSLQKMIGGNFTHHCGAVLIDETTALTAAHCFTKKSKEADFTLVAGMRRLVESGSTTRQTRNVTKFIQHPKWNGKFFDGNDIALVIAEGSFDLNDNVAPVWISSPDDPILSDFNGTATGWGKFENSDKITENLTKVDLPLLSDQECKNINNIFKESMTCARTGRSNVCNGDSGGPLVIQNYEFPEDKKRDLLVGITSFGPGKCDDVAQPSAFTKISSFYNWIVRNWERRPKANPNTTATATTTLTNKFRCFNGQEIDEDWRCDEEFDCEDGSDEKGCNVKIKDEARQKTRACGGEIKLVDEYDILFLVDSKKKGTTQCDWTIYNSKNNSIQLTLLAHAEAQFRPNQHQLIAISNFSPRHFYYKIINQVGQKRKIQDSFTTLIFRGPEGIPNSGFHLRLKSVGVDAEENPLRFKKVDLKATPPLQNYSYPSSGFHGGGFAERVLTFLTPSTQGGKIILNLDFRGMEPQRNWFDVISIGKQPKSLFRVSEARASGTQRVEGEKGETLLLFLNTGTAAFNQSTLKFTYSEKRSLKNPEKKISCGGQINLDGSQDLTYRANSSKTSCLWVVSGGRGGSFLLSLLNFRNPLFNPVDSSLDILHNFTRHHSVRHHLNEFGGGYLVDQPFFLLYFRSSPFSTTTGFYLRVRYSNSTGALNLQQRNLTPILNQTQEFSYSPDHPRNSNSNSNSTQSTIILVQPTRNQRKVHLNLKNIHLPDADEEWIEIMSFHQRAVSLYRSSGSKNMTDKSFISSEGEPFVIFLKSKSKSNRQKKSVTFSYSEEQEILEPIRSCGGVVNVSRRHEINFRAPPGQRSHCLWVIRNAHGPHSNITAQFDAANSQLIMIQDKFTSSINMKRKQPVMTKSGVTALLFRSNGNARGTVLITVDGVGDYGYGDEAQSQSRSRTGTGAGENSLETKTISLESTSQEVRRFGYPRAPALTYDNNQRLFILINPGKSAETGKKIQLNLTSVDTEPNFDRLEIYTLRRGDGNNNKNLHLEFGFDGLGSWTNKTFLGEPNEPVLVYFRSDSFTVKSGFKFKYTSVA